MQGEAWGVPLRLDALVEDGMGHRWEDVLWLTLDPWQSYLPVVTRLVLGLGRYCSCRITSTTLPCT